jgi:uncharacterized membrane protein YhaH (DUF805 family)
MAAPEKTKSVDSKQVILPFLRRFMVGRLSRLGFIFGFVYYLCIVVGALILFALAGSFLLSILSPHASQDAFIEPIVGMVIVCYLVTILWEISLYVRRLHDVGRPGWLAFLGFVPFANIIFFIYLLVAPGSADANDYGPPMLSHSFRAVTLLKRHRTTTD